MLDDRYLMMKDGEASVMSLICTRSERWTRSHDLGGMCEKEKCELGSGRVLPFRPYVVSPLRHD
jgi:hypothetical protein